MNKVIFLSLCCSLAYIQINAMSTALIKATERGDQANVEALINIGTEIDAEDVFGNTALHVAPTLEIAQILLDHGAKVNHRNRIGCTPLYHAIFYNKPDIVRLLIERGALILNHTRLAEPARCRDPLWLLSRSLNEHNFQKDPDNFILNGIDYLSEHDLPLDVSFILASQDVPLLKMAAMRGNLQIWTLLEMCMEIEKRCHRGRLALCMAMHPRLNAASPVALLSPFEIKRSVLM